MKPTLFDFNGAAVRVMENETGIWFVASDVCRVLDLGNPRSSLALLDEDEKGVHSMDTPGGSQEITILSESGVYSLILRSRKQEAKAFKKWVTRDVLPAIRQTGAYALPGQIATNRVPANFVEALRLAADAEEQRQVLQLQLEEAAPKLETYDRVMNGQGLFTFRQVAAMMAEPALGGNNLVKRLLSERILYRDQKGKILAFRQYIEAGHFKAVESPYTVKETDESRVGCQIKVTPSGVAFIARKFGATINTQLELVS